LDFFGGTDHVGPHFIDLFKGYQLQKNHHVKTTLDGQDRTLSADENENEGIE